MICGKFYEDWCMASFSPRHLLFYVAIYAISRFFSTMKLHVFVWLGIPKSLNMRDNLLKIQYIALPTQHFDTILFRF